MDTAESIAFVLGVVTVTLLVQRSIWNYPFAIASVALYAAVFFSAKLYSDAALQLFFIAVNGYGWWNWHRVRVATGDVPVETLTPGARIGWLVGWLLATVVWGMVMYRHTDAAFPFADAAIAIASVSAQVLLAQRKVENWLIWIAVDVASVPLYAAKGLYLTLVLYLIYLALSVWGWISWRRVMRTERIAAA